MVFTTQEEQLHQGWQAVIEAHKEQYKGRPYTSAKLESKGKADFTYGKFSFRAKLPYAATGRFTAIWMMTDFQDKNAKYGGWPMCGEIDIMELVGHKPDTVHGTLHYGNPGRVTFTQENPDVSASGRSG